MTVSREKMLAVIAKQEIYDLLATYCRGINRCDSEALRSVFHPQATVEYGLFTGLAESFCSQVMGTIRNHHATMHTVCNVLIELQGSEAFGETYFVAYMIGNSNGVVTDTIIGGRYLDRFTHADGRWWIRERLVVMDWNRQAPAMPLDEKQRVTEWGISGTHDRDDPVYKRRKLSESAAPRMAGQLSGESTMLKAACDRQDIYEVLMRYCRGIDRCDEQALRSVYHPDAYEEHQMFNGTASQFCDFILPLVADHLTGMHAICNVLIDVDGSCAHGESYFVAYASDRHPDGKTYDRTICGRYLDRFEERDGVWKIAYRQVVMDWNQLCLSTAKWDEGMFASLRVRGMHGRGDPLYSRRSRVLGS